jgi:protein AroM
MAGKIGAITVGQAPRVDVMPDLEPILDGIEVIQRGALDGMTRDALKHIEPEAKEYILVTRLSDGSSVQIAEKYILPRIQEHINYLIHYEEVKGILMLCTGEFPSFDCPVPLLYPQVLLQHFTMAVLGDRTLGVLTPADGQIRQAGQRWHRSGAEKVLVEAASPYESFDLVVEKAVELKDSGAQLLVMDCIGYTQAMKEAIRTKTGVPVILGRTVAAHAAAELFG